MRHDYIRHGTTALFAALNNSRARGRRTVHASCSTSTSRSADKTRMRQVAEALIALSRYQMASPPPMSPLTPLTMANLLKLTHVIPPPSLSLKWPNPPHFGADDFRVLADGCIDLIVGSGAGIQ
jgi:hypothetical protein